MIALAILIGFALLPAASAQAGPTSPPSIDPVGPPDLSAETPLDVAVTGTFRDFTTGEAIAGARIAIVRPDGTLAGTVIADSAGGFTLNVGTVVGAELTATYEAPGYLRQASAVRASEPQLTLDPLLTPQGVKEAVLYSLPQSPMSRQITSAGPAAAVAGYSFLASLITPVTIRVYITELKVVQVVDFKFYCKHVLPCEWLVQWPAESLRAGAIAVKEYAWYYISKGGKYPNIYYPDVDADVTDRTYDQWYDPARSDPRTDAAVDHIWDKVLLRNGALFLAQFCGHLNLDADYRCELHLSRMPQWGTFYLAQNGWNWQQIVHHYYDYSGPITIANTGGTTVPCTTIMGTDRFDTAVRLSKAMYPNGLPAGSGLVLAPGETFQEALCGAPLAAAYGGPVLLTPAVGLNNGVRDEILRLGPSTVVCIGLSATVVDQVKAAVASSGATVTPITAADVYDMSYQVAEALDYATGGLSGAVALITRGDVFPDAIGVSPLACYQEWPVLLTNGATGVLHPSAADALGNLGITSAVKVGTYAALPQGVTGVANLSGADRYETNRNMAVWGKANAGLTVAHLGLATGDKFPDALAAGPYMARDHGVLLLSPLNGPLPASISYLISDNAGSVDKVTFIAMIEPVISQVQALLP